MRMRMRELWRCRWVVSAEQRQGAIMDGLGEFVGHNALCAESDFWTWFDGALLVACEVCMNWEAIELSKDSKRLSYMSIQTLLTGFVAQNSYLIPICKWLDWSTFT